MTQIILGNNFRIDKFWSPRISVFYILDDESNVIMLTTTTKLYSHPGWGQFRVCKSEGEFV